jgi:hypothetical protein
MHFQSIGKVQRYTADQISEYGLILAFCADWLKAKFPVEKCPIRDVRGRFAKKETA